MILINEFIRLEYTETNLVRLNRVRKHFKVIYMSDVTEGNGKKIKENIYNGIKDYTTTSKYVWGKEVPATKDYKIWRLAMRNITQDRILPRRLGKWLETSHNIERWSYDKTNGCLIAGITKNFYIFQKLHT